MKTVQNEKGYTLLLTLVIIFIIIIFFSSFSLSAINQQKQAEKTDETYEVVAIAEMGVEYYQTKVVNIIANHSKIAKDNIVALPADKLNDSSISNIKATQMLLLKTEIGTFLGNSNSPEIEVFDSSTFKLSNYVNKTDSSIPHGESWTIYVTGSIDGENKLKTKTISATFALPADFNLVSTTLTSGTGDSTGSGNPVGGSFNFSPLVIVPTFPETDYSKVSGITINQCPNDNATYGNIKLEYYCFSNDVTKVENLINLNLYYTGTTDLDKDINMNQSFKNLNNFYSNKSINLIKSFSTKKNTSYYIKGNFNKAEPINDPDKVIIYATGNITLKNINNMTSMEIYSNKNVSFTEPFDANNLTLSADSGEFKTLNSFKHSTIEIKKTLEKSITTFPQINSFDNSKIQIHASASFPSLNNGIYNESIISVKENATFGSTGTGIINSNINVGGIANFNNVVKLKNSTMQVGGNAKFFIQNSEAGMESSTIVVDSISFTAAANNAKFEISNGSKLCIRNGNYDSIKSFVNVNAAGGNKSEIIFLGPPNKHENGFISYYEEKTFNSVCGITATPNVPSNSYKIKDSPLPSQEEITTKIEYN